MVEIMGAVFCIVAASITLFISIRSFLEKGFLFNNAYLWASTQEREKMDKKPYYRQTGIVFALLSMIFVCNAIEFLVNTGWLWIVNAGIVAATIVYAIVSSAKQIK